MDKCEKDCRTLHSILVKSIPPADIQLHLGNNPLHSILVKSIPLFFSIEVHFAPDLHSILVKSIPFFPIDVICAESHLHSILVKSIPHRRMFRHCQKRIYIPFWLNLYPCQTPTPCRLICIYIPFWLNLYSASFSILSFISVFTFHSG